MKGMTPSSPTSTPKGMCSRSPRRPAGPTSKSQARQENIGANIDRAMDVIERDNKPLQSVLPKNYGRDDLDKQVLGQVVDLVSNIKVGGTQATDVLGQVYEYFLEQFAIAVPGQAAGQERPSTSPGLDPQSRGTGPPGTTPRSGQEEPPGRPPHRPLRRVATRSGATNLPTPQTSAEQ